jgi:hypothetical protein
MCPETLILRVIAKRILCRHTQQFSITAWVRIVDYCLVGSHVLPQRVTGNHYRDSLLHDLPKLEKDVTLAVRAGMWYVRDGAPVHFRRAVRDTVSNTWTTDRSGFESR